jgi:uncharacterized membrane protein
MHDRKYTMLSVLFLFFLAGLLMIRQITSQGYFSCINEDTYTYTSWAWQFAEALKEGNIYPRWLALNYWGYGGPVFILYPPLAFYGAAFFNIMTGSIITAMNMTKFSVLFLSGLGMFFLVREFYSEKTALLTASFYILLPYTIFQFYYVGTFASTISFMWFAPIILFTYRYMKDRNYKNVIYAGLCYGGLILTHPINAYMFTFVLVAFITYMSIAKKNLKDIILVPLIALIGVLISAVYIVPVIFEKKFLNYTYFIGEGGGPHFAFHNFFILPNLTGILPSDHLWSEYYDTFVFFLLFFCVLILLFLYQKIKMRHIKTDGDTNAALWFFLVTAGASIFLLFGISRFLWETIPFFRYIQFPSRWLIVTTFATVFLSSILFWSKDAVSKAKKKKVFLIVLVLLVCLLSDYKYIVSAYMFPEQKLIPVKTSDWTLEHIPIWVDVEKIYRNDDDRRVIIQSGEGKAEVLSWKSAERIIEIIAEKPLTSRIRIFNFPGWKAYLNGIRINIKTEEGTGAMLIKIPRGKHNLILQFEDTTIRYYSKLISLSSFLITILLIIFSRKYAHKKTPKNIV